MTNESRQAIGTVSPLLRIPRRNTPLRPAPQIPALSARAEDHEFLQAILRGIRDGITIQETTGKLLYANAVAAEMLGYPTIEALLAAPVRDVVSKFEIMDENGNPLPLSELPGRKALQGKDSPEILVCFRIVATNEMHWSVVRAIPIRDDAGMITAAINIFHDVTEEHRQHAIDQFLAAASNVLSSSLDYEKTLKTIADLAVPTIADWCRIDALNEEGEYEMFAVAHKNPEMLVFAKQVSEKYPTDYDSASGLGNVLRTKKSELYSHIPDDLLAASISDPERLALTRKIGMQSAMIVPMVARGAALGAITFISAESGIHFGQQDLEVAEDLAQRAALAIDNAKQYREVRRLNRELEKRVAERTVALEQEVETRKYAQEEERAHLQRLKDIVNHLPLGAIAVDERHRILHINRLMGSLFPQCNPEKFVGETIESVFDVMKGNTLYPAEYYRQITGMVERRHISLGSEIYLKSGTILSRDYVPLHVNGRYRGFLLLYRDITREKKIDASKSEFMSLASHQLRTPLTAIRWALGKMETSLAKGQTGERERRLLAESRRAAVRMADTIDTMLTISRIEAGKLEPNIQRIRLQNLLEELQQQFQRAYEEKRQSFTIHCAADLWCENDEQMLKEVLRNLTHNAIKYTPEGGTVSLAADARGDDIVLTVQDTGYGIPSYQQEKLFSKFFRGDNVVSLDTNGTGLGLYMTSLLIRLLRGSISFISKEQQGTTFTVSLPRTAHGS
jgi:signal transduction histidine kinase/GAF domain-containing protein